MLQRDLRRRAMDNTEAFEGFYTAGLLDQRPVQTALVKSGEENAVSFCVTAEYDAVYRIHVFRKYDKPCSYEHLINDTFPTYKSNKKSLGDGGAVQASSYVSFYLPLKKGKNTIRYFYEYDGGDNNVFVCGVSSVRVSPEYSEILYGPEMLVYDCNSERPDHHGYAETDNTFMVRNTDGSQDTLSLNLEKQKAIPAGRYRIGLCCSSISIISIASAGVTITKKAQTYTNGLTNTTTGAAYIDTEAEIENIAEGGLSLKVETGNNGWINIGAIILHKIS